MNREDVIRMAREAEIIDFRDESDDPHVAQMVDFLERFAALVAAEERRKHQADIETWKAEAATAEKWRGMAHARHCDSKKVVQEVQREAVEREREACALACEDRAGTVSMFGTAKECAAHNGAIDECAAAIRARGQA